MNQRGTLEISAAPIAYVVLTGIWFGLAIVYVFLYLRLGRHGLLLGAVIAAIVGGGLWLWLKGFAVALDPSFLQYRDGLYHRFRISRNEISSVENAWIEWEFLGKRVSLPRLVVHSKTGTPILINTKLFRKADIRQLHLALRSSASENEIVEADGNNQ